MAIPQLRFKEFDGGWSNIKLKKMVKSLDAGVSVNAENTPPKNDEFSVLKTSCVSLGYFDINERKTVKEAVEVERLKEPLLDGSLVMNRSNTPALVGASAFIKSAPKNTFLSDKLWQFKVFDNTNIKWLAFYLSSEKTLVQLRDLATGTSNSMKNITKPDVLNIDLFVPQKAEQSKIASFLSAVDEKISQLTQKHELLRQYKQGMMQKLFSQQLRFKADDGSKFGEWEKTTLEKIGTFLKGKGISKADIVSDGQVPCVRYGELYTHYGEVISKVISATNIDVSNLVLSKANDVLIPASGETQIDIATASCVLNEGVALSGDLNVLRTKENGIFLSYLIRSKLKMKIAQLAQGNSVVHLYATQLKGVELSLPCLEEQTKIANFLTAIDQKIEVVAQQIEQAKTWKKGLLQQMFV